MKRQILLACTFFGVIICHGQSLDSLKQRILALEMNQRNIQLNLAKGHKKFTAGTILIISGLVTTAADIFLIKTIDVDYHVDGDGNKRKPILSYIGAGLMTAGCVVQIDSHRFIGRAGRKRK